jgi:hypothetical protein
MYIFAAVSYADYYKSPPKCVNKDKFIDELKSSSAEGTWKLEFKGKTVTKDNSLFDPNRVDSKGRTNIQRMEKGLAPEGYDGKPVNIHHIDQTNNGPVMEISGSSHQQGYSNLHQNTGQAPSQINRTDFNAWRTDYWKWRANDFK